MIKVLDTVRSLVYAGVHVRSALDLVSIFPTVSKFRKLERSSTFFSMESKDKAPVDPRYKKG